MKYRVEKLGGNMCSVKLVPERPSEAGLIAQGEPEDKFRAHYQEALTKYIDKDAVLVDIVNRQH